METNTDILKEKELTSITDRMLKKRKSDLKLILDISHRLEVVAEIDGVEFINDAKASDLEATAYSLDCINRPIIWMLESGEYQRDFIDLEKSLLKNVESIIVIGQNRSNTVEELMQLSDVVAEAANIEDGISMAKELAYKGCSVLYSPAIPNNNKYRNYISRGEAFKRALEN